MKFEQFQPQPKEQLDEVRMGMSDLDLFIESPEADGIKAGFEAEMCFVGRGGGDTDYDNPEEDMSMDETATSIDDVCNFYHDGDYNGRRDIQDLRSEMEEQYLEWRSEKLSEEWDEVAEEKVGEYIAENDYDRDEEIFNYLSDHLDLDSEQAQAVIDSSDDKEGNPDAYALYKEAVEYAENVLTELVEQALSERNDSYDNAREEWEEYVIDDGDYDEHQWLRDIGIRYMSDVLGEFRGHVSWPYYEYPQSESGYNEHEAGRLADSLSDALDVETYASGGYHGATRTATRWIFEPDSSLEADDGDMPVEIISPPMPLKECLSKIELFFQWAAEEDSYTNNSTGFHVGVSLPHVDGRIDYVKLALFLGDKHVLETFDRMGNYYCKSAFDKIRDGVNSEKIPDAYEVMRKGLIELASKTLKQQGGHGKYTSINLKNDYVEFRSMGDEYHNKVPEILNTVKRYAYAMYIASRPDLHREEYAKKLYKMLSKSGEADAIALFSQLASGALSKDELRQKLVTRNVKRQGVTGKKYWWNVKFPGGSRIELVAATEQEAKEKAVKELEYHESRVHNATAEVIKPYEEPPIKATSGEPEPIGRANDRVGTEHWQIVNRSSDTVAAEFLVNSEEEAKQKLAAYVERHGHNPLNYTLRRVNRVEPTDDVTPATQARGGFTGEWKVIDNNGRELYRFGGVGNSQADANRIAQQWVNNQRERGHHIDAREIDVLPVMGNQ
jgi:hypothetical protein